MPRSFCRAHLSGPEATARLPILITSADTRMALGRAPEIGAKDLWRLAENPSDAKAGGAEIESKIFTNPFPIALLLACPSAEHNTNNLSTMLFYRYKLMTRKLHARCI